MLSVRFVTLSFYTCDYDLGEMIIANAYTQLTLLEAYQNNVCLLVNSLSPQNYLYFPLRYAFLSFQ